MTRKQYSAPKVALSECLRHVTRPGTGKEGERLATLIKQAQKDLEDAVQQPEPAQQSALF